MKNLLAKYKESFKNTELVISIVASLLLFMVGLVATYFAIIYANETASSPVTDVILSNVRVFDVDGFFVYGPVVFWVILGLYVISDLKRLPFTLKSIGLFLIIRSIFISLTHIGPFPTHVQLNSSSGVLGVFTSGNDLFFSSHTGMPFLMALAFWNNKYVRYFSLAASIFFGTVVLLAHLHYSIDVFAAFFITYGIFHISEKWFKWDRQIFKSAN